MTTLAQLLRLPAAATGVALALAGCASQAEMETAYGHALFDWRGATRAQLLAKWGPPQAVAAANGVEELTWIVTEADAMPQGQTTVTYARPATLPGGAGAVATPSVSAGGMVPAVPLRCITRFELHDGVVKDWSYRGVACGAPGFMPPAR